MKTKKRSFCILLSAVLAIVLATVLSAYTFYDNDGVYYLNCNVSHTSKTVYASGQSYYTDTNQPTSFPIGVVVKYVLSDGTLYTNPNVMGYGQVSVTIPCSMSVTASQAIYNTQGDQYSLYG